MKIKLPKLNLSYQNFKALATNSFEFKFAFVVLILGLLSYYSPSVYIPLKNHSQNTITVHGLASDERDNNTATFSINLNENNPDKAVVVASINSKMDEVTKKVKEFGISEKDIKSAYYNVYQGDKFPYDAQVPEKVWYVTSTLEVKLRDISNIDAFTDMISAMGFTEFYGPNFSFENSESLQNALLNSAIDDATQKALSLSKHMGRTLGPVITVSEDGVSNVGMYYDRAMSGGGGFQPGATEISKTVVVTFELK